MRAALACLATVLLASCHSHAAKIDTIEIHRSGWVSYNVVVHANGTGEFEGSPTLPEKGKRAFTLQPGQFQQLVSAIEPYMRFARPVTDASIHDVVVGNWPNCPTKKGYMVDAPALYLHWQGPKTNVHYLVDFGCDYDANRTRNERLLDAVHQLPIRQFLGAFG
jgi:hypothetical protein